jgi:hypothetical protein
MSETKQARKRKTGRPAKSIEERAAEEGVSVATLRRRLRGGGSQITREDKLREEVRKLRAEATKAERMISILDTEYLPRAVVERSVSEVAHVCNALLRAAESELPPLVAGQSPERAEKTIKRWTEAWAGRLQDARDAVWTEAQREIERELRGDLKKVAKANRRG